jgi:hypothetical protein
MDTGSVIPDSIRDRGDGLLRRLFLILENAAQPPSCQM